MLKKMAPPAGAFLLHSFRQLNSTVVGEKLASFHHYPEIELRITNPMSYDIGWVLSGNKHATHPLCSIQHLMLAFVSHQLLEMRDRFCRDGP